MESLIFGTVKWIKSIPRLLGGGVQAGEKSERTKRHGTMLGGKIER